MSEPYPISITKTGDAIVGSIDIWRDVQEKIGRFFAERTEEEAVRQLREIGFERVVRCRDCKYAEPDDSGRSYYKDMLWCSELGGDDSMPVEYDDFCTWGERRDA